jgi:broad specificity phosphatase PhoE
MTWYILRHAEKERGDFHNPQLRHQDQPLSDRGRQEAEKWAGYFTDKAIAAIYVSGYIRTRQTVERAAEALQLLPVMDERLNELDNGLVDEMTEEQFRQAYPQEWKAYCARTADFRFPGGETGADAQSRILEFVAEKQRQHAGENILVVTHEGLIRVWMCTLLGLPVFHRGDFKVDLCGLTEVTFQEDVQRWKLIRFNQVYP